MLRANLLRGRGHPESFPCPEGDLSAGSGATLRIPLSWFRIAVCVYQRRRAVNRADCRKSALSVWKLTILSGCSQAK